MAVESTFHKTHCGKTIIRLLRPASNQVTSIIQIFLMIKFVHLPVCGSLSVLNLLHRSLHLQAIMCGFRGGIGVPDPLPWKITSYMGFYRNYYLEPPPPYTVGPPPWKILDTLKPWKIILSFEVTIGHPLKNCKIG